MEKKSVYNMVSEINTFLSSTIPEIASYESTTDMEKVRKQLNNDNISVKEELENMYKKLSSILQNEELKKPYKNCPKVYEQCRDFVIEMEKELQKLIHILSIYKDYRQVEKMNLDFVRVSASMDILLKKVTEYEQKIKNIIPSKK